MNQTPGYAALHLGLITMMPLRGFLGGLLGERELDGSMGNEKGRAGGRALKK